MNDTITVRYKGSLLSVSKVVAKNMNLTSGQVIRTENIFWWIIKKNAEYGIMVNRAAIEADERRN